MSMSFVDINELNKRGQDTKRKNVDVSALADDEDDTDLDEEMQ